MPVFVRIVLFGSAVLLLVLTGTQPRTDAATPVYADVAKIFEKHCTSCHSGARAPDKFRMETYKDVMQGGRNGAMVLPGDPAGSEIIRRVKGTSTPRMPKNGPPWLSADEVRILEKWVENGAPEA